MERMATETERESEREIYPPKDCSAPLFKTSLLSRFSNNIVWQCVFGTLRTGPLCDWCGTKQAREQWRTLHLHMEHGVLGERQTAPLRRVMPAGSWHVCLMSYATLSARQGSVTHRGQHSPSDTAVYSQGNAGQASGQQSTSPSCRESQREAEFRETDRHKEREFRGFTNL